MHPPVPKSDSLGHQFEALVELVGQLRENCPWDKVQTWDTLRKLTIEECYELVEALESKDNGEMKKELGDVLLHVLFYGRIGEEESRFNTHSIITTLREKLISRHPHIYGEVEADSGEQVLHNWEKIKLAEAGNSEKRLLSGVPKGLPAMVKALRLQEKTASIGFDWPDIQSVKEKLDEELAELEDVMALGDKERIKDELGDVFFSLINLARKMGIDPDASLESTNRKFITRFNYVETSLLERGERLGEATLAQMDELWNEAKTLLEP